MFDLADLMPCVGTRFQVNGYIVAGDAGIIEEVAAERVRRFDADQSAEQVCA